MMVFVLTMAIIEIIYYFDIFTALKEIIEIKQSLIGISIFIIMWFITTLYILLSMDT